jgi:hypothetical protein
MNEWPDQKTMDTKWTTHIFVVINFTQQKNTKKLAYIIKMLIVGLFFDIILCIS